MFTDLSRMVKEQEVEIGQIYGNIDESHAKTREAFANVIEANKLHQAGNCIISQIPEADVNAVAFSVSLCI